MFQRKHCFSFNQVQSKIFGDIKWFSHAKSEHSVHTLNNISLYWITKITISASWFNYSKIFFYISVHYHDSIEGEFSLMKNISFYIITVKKSMKIVHDLVQAFIHKFSIRTKKTQKFVEIFHVFLNARRNLTMW